MRRKVKDIPFDIICEILYQLPVKSLLRFRNLSDLYRRTIDDPKFMTTYHARVSRTLFLEHRSSIIYQLEESHGYFLRPTTMAFPHIKEVSRVLCAAQGFLLLMLSDGKFCLWNPSRRESINLASVSRGMVETLFGFFRIGLGLGLGLGLGFDSSMTEYKIVYISILSEERRSVLIYSSNTKSWKQATNNLPALHHIASDYSRHTTAGLFCNGSIHWLYFSTQISVSLLSFDMKTEEFSLVALEFLNSFGRQAKLTELGGYLAIGETFGVQGYRRLEKVWILMEGKWKTMDIEHNIHGEVEVHEDDYNAHYYVNHEGSKLISSNILLRSPKHDVFRCKETLLSLKNFEVS